MREIMISIQPKWVEKICRKEKTVEVRKTRPKCEVPFKCYIYCTTPKNKHDNLVLTPFGYDVGSESAYCNYTGNSNGKVIGEFVCDRIIASFLNNNDGWFKELGCLSQKEIDEYQGDKSILYGWHITDLVVYDKPRELSEFAKPAKIAYDDEGYLLCDGCEFANWNIDRVCTIDFCPERMITRPPQSWQFCISKEPRQTAD